MDGTPMNMDGASMDGTHMSSTLMNGASQDGTPGSSGPMNDMQKYMHNTFWLDDRVSFTYRFTQRLIPEENQHAPDGPPPPLRPIFLSSPILQFISTKNDDINTKVIADTNYSLEFFSEEETGGRIYFPPSKIDAYPPEQTVGRHMNLPPGIYVFTAAPGSSETSILIFFRLKKKDAVPAIDPMAEPGKVATTKVPVLRIVNEINQYLQDPQNGLIYSDADTTVELTSCAPAWLCGATDSKTQGCPLSPPIPAPVDEGCSFSHGLWPFTLPGLPHELQTVTGDSVTVLVLDTLPQYGQIKRAAEGAGQDNLLLLDVFNNATFRYPPILGGLDVPGPSQAGTGKDIHGKLIGFRMPDHGLFIAGIIHDIAPDANMECIRVLNDFCSGSVQTLIAALQDIGFRMSEGGDLYDEQTKQARSVVINLSLVIPDDNEVLKQVRLAGIDPALFFLDKTREGLLKAIQRLVDRGAIFVASAGNEGDQRFNPMSSVRPKALYPAAYAYNGLSHAEQMIPVGAVNKKRKATEYSCYPGELGFATYGGDLPGKKDIKDGHGKRMTTVNLRKIDAPVGMYTSLFYPALSNDDPEFRYPAPNACCWAYWVGTSFATPIVSAIAARMVEWQKRNPPLPATGGSPRPIVAPAATGKTTWTNLDVGAASSTVSPSPLTNIEGPMIVAVQCKPGVINEKEEEGTAEVREKGEKVESFR